MKKIFSLIRASMSSDMNLFKIKSTKNNKKNRTPILIAIFLMFMVWCYANAMYEEIAPMHIQFALLSLFAIAVSFITFLEGIYKSGSLIFNCKDDQLLLSLPINKNIVIFIRIIKFYTFELIYNSLFLLPTMIAYIRWAEKLDWTYFMTSVVMLFLLPIIPIVISCFIGAFITSLSNKFKYKNIVQIVLSMILILGIFYISYQADNLIEYFMKNATSINDLITKIYYPAGVYSKLIIEFNISEFLIFIALNISIFAVGIIILSKFYFKINSQTKVVITSKKVKTKDIRIKSNNKVISLVKKELNTFFKTPVFIVNSGFALVLFMMIVVSILLKFDSLILAITQTEDIGITKEAIMNNLSIVILVIIIFTAYMTSITNSLISLEGKNINILKSLPIKVKTILMSKIYACLVITTPVLLIGNIILFIKFNRNIVDIILLLLLTILIPLVSHFIGIIVNLKYPKLDAENSTEVVKQSISSFLSVLIGMILLVINLIIILNIVNILNETLILIIITIIYLIVDYTLYQYLAKVGVKEFNNLTI